MSDGEGVENHYLVEHGSPEEVQVNFSVHGGKGKARNSIQYNEDLQTAIYERVKKAADWYLQPRGWERWEDGRVYEMLGTDYFKKIVPTWGTYVNDAIEKVWGSDEFRPTKAHETKEEGLYKHLQWTSRYEMGHLGASAVVGGVMLKEGVSPDLVAKQVIFNVYPMLLQRYNRARIHNLLDENAPGWRETDEWSDQLLEE